MKDPSLRFNAVLGALLLGLLTGCSSSSSRKPKPLNSIRIHVETRHDIPERSFQVEVGRENPMRFQVEKLPILNENHVERASLVERPGGFEVRIKWNEIGSQLLENYTSAAMGRHMLIMTDIDGEGRWIAAPLIRRRISDGVVTFTPDATREEMERLVQGLNRSVEKKRKQWLN